RDVGTTADVARRRAGEHRVLPRHGAPVAHTDVEDLEGVVGEADLDNLALAGSELHFRESPELARRAESADCRIRFLDIDLHDLVTGNRTGVGDGHPRRTCVGDEVSVREGRVTEAMPE